MSLHPGQRVCFSGHFLTARTELAARARWAGLLVDESVTVATDVLVANDAGSGAASVRAAIAAGVPILDEYAFDDLLAARI